MQHYIESLRRDGNRLATIIELGPLDAHVPSCAGWQLRDLAHHMGYIHRWARLSAATAARPDESQIDAPPPLGPDEPAELAEWLRTGVEALITTLAVLAPEAPTWHPFTVARVAAVWPRRQAHELAVHRWDAEHAVGAETPFDAALAADFVREYFEVIVPRVAGRDGRTPPTGTVRISFTDNGNGTGTGTDTGDSFVVRVDGTGVSVVADDAQIVDAELSGPAAELVLALWNRAPISTMPDNDLARAWLSFGGN